MSSVDVRPAARAEWAPANPWLWMLTGLAATGGAFLWVQTLGERGTPVRFLLIALGLLAAGVATWIRLSSTRPAFVEAFTPRWRQWMLAGLAAVGGVMALATTVLLCMGIAGVEDLPWPLGSLVLMWVLVAPWGAWLALTFFRSWRGASGVTRSEECAALLTLAALAAFAASWALYLGADQAEDWDSIRLALAVLALVALVAAPLTAVSRGVRRAVLAVLVVLHFGGIATAVMSAPPTPWLVGQIWVRFYRPYLEFMYLNNAYHFYAPEPGPASYLWFRIESLDVREKIHSHWIKIPDMDDNTGKPRYPVALEYQRMLALTENTARNSPTPSMVVTGPDGMQHVAAFYDQRVKHSEFAAGGPVMIGNNRPEPPLIIPFHPELPPLNQYQAPNLDSKRILESFARFIMHRAAARDPERVPVRVKVYRVVHAIPDAETMAAGWDPCFPTLYVPFYMGEFDREGKMTSAGAEDPFLYWLLPILKKDKSKPDSEILAYVFRHAGEPAWILDTTDAKVKTKLKLPEDR